MAIKYPFHYEVRARLLAFDKLNNVRIETFTRTFSNKNPLKSRSDAFEALNDYIAFKGQGGWIQEIDDGNLRITQPSFISDTLANAKNKKDSDTYYDTFNYYKEEVSVVLVVDDLSIAKEIAEGFEFEGKVDNEFEIHTVASYQLEPQDLIDNLDIHEMPLYIHYNINVDELKETVFHYGLDYAESGEDEDSGAKRVILRTPYVWDTFDKYKKLYSAEDASSEETENDEGINWLDIIEKGESKQIEFKPSLLYNFKTHKAGISIKYIISKAICAFLNSNGGVIFIGVNDNGTIQGLEQADYLLFEGENEKDKLILELDSLLEYFFNASIIPLIWASVENINGKDILIVSVSDSPKPVFLQNKKDGQVQKEMYIRRNASTKHVIDIEEIVEYIFNKEWKKPSR